jgi:hypothetical protein
MQLLLLEGVPGSGKTTTAKETCKLLSSIGIRANWYLEEAAEHPIHPRSITKLRDDPGFMESCFKQWGLFVDPVQQEEGLHIMEGSAFQSTVRFMMENDMDGIDHYFSEFVNVVKPLSPAMVYLRPNDIVKNSRYICKLRGENWATKVANYETHTPFSNRRNLSGIDGMHSFWKEYASLCDSWLPLWTLPSRTIKFEPGDWQHHIPEVWRLLAELDVIPMEQ